MRLVFIADEFKLRGPEQQLLDRFLIGYPHEGRFYKPDCEVVLVLPEKNEVVERRIKDFALRWQAEPADGDAYVIFTLSPPRAPLALSRPFFYGAYRFHPPPISNLQGPAGTAIRGAWLLPNIFVPKKTHLTKGLVIVQGASPTAELEAFDALLPLIWDRKQGETNVRAEVTPLDRNNFWQVLKRDFWPLLKSAISRSDRPQGDPVRDGRTQDLAGLSLLETLVKEPRGWLVRESDGFQYVIAVMDEAIADCNVAVQTGVGGIISAQVYRPPAPGEHHYSRLAAMLERYFCTGIEPWPPGQGFYAARLLKEFGLGKGPFLEYSG